MPAKIRLQRHGKKGKPFFHIVVADSRAKRDGGHIERLGHYNPNTNPATIHLDVDKALGWLQNGAQPTHTARAILSYKGVLYKRHLLGGVEKGAFDQAEADKRFEAWHKEKEDKINRKVQGIAKADQEARQKQIEAARKANEEKEAASAEAEKAQSPETAAGTEAETPRAQVKEKDSAPQETKKERDQTKAAARETVESKPDSKEQAADEAPSAQAGEKPGE